MSEGTYLLLHDRFRFEDRGIIAVKGKGEVRAYLLKGDRRAEQAATDASHGWAYPGHLA